MSTENPTPPPERPRIGKHCILNSDGVLEVDQATMQDIYAGDGVIRSRTRMLERWTEALADRTTKAEEESKALKLQAGEVSAQITLLMRKKNQLLGLAQSTLDRVKTSQESRQIKRHARAISARKNTLSQREARKAAVKMTADARARKGKL